VDGVNILSHFCNPSGIQQAAFWVKVALERAGLRTSCRDVPVPRRVVPNDREKWLGLEIFPVTILTQAATPYFESGYERSGLLPKEGVYRIAYWNWELEAVPDEWVEVAELVDEIWSPTKFVAQAMRSRMPRPVYHMLPGVEVGPIETVTRRSLNIPENHTVFLFMFDLHSQLHRKNPGAVFRAFRAAFRDDDQATLVIKTSGGDIHSADLALLRETIRGRNVILLDEMMTRAEAYGLIEMCDCFVSLHRSEGFGLGLAEAMLMAKPVIATGYSGNLDFMNRENSFLVDYERVEIKEDRPIYTRGNFWAEPSIEQAAAYMREVYERRDEARARAQRTQAETQSLLSLEAAGERMRARLDQIAIG
jgi:glycosyltransferase involved in cell wall biosynthesis